MHRAYTLAEMQPGPIHARGLTLMARNDEPDPCRAADAYEQSRGDYTDRMERARALVKAHGRRQAIKQIKQARRDARSIS